MVTLVHAPGRLCRGVAYLVEHSVFEHLDHREKNGYQRFPVQIAFDSGAQIDDGVVYVADQHNPAFLCAAPLAELAQHIDSSHGPSGSNRDYLLNLAEALRELGDNDPHVHALEALLRP